MVVSLLGLGNRHLILPGLIAGQWLQYCTIIIRVNTLICFFLD